MAAAAAADAAVAPPAPFPYPLLILLFLLLLLAIHIRIAIAIATDNAIAIPIVGRAVVNVRGVSGSGLRNKSCQLRDPRQGFRSDRIWKQKEMEEEESVEES